MDWDVVVVGSTNIDLMLTVPRHPHPGETLIGSSGELFAGGKGANQAVAAARLGARTAMVGAVGDDANSAVALSELVAADVDLSAMRRVPGPTGLAVVTLSDDGENTIIVVPGANAAVTAEAVASASDVIRAAKVLLLQVEIPLAAVVLAAEIAASAGARVVLNLAPACPMALETLRLADPLVLNEHEVALLLGWLDDAEIEAASDRAAALHAARKLRAHGVPSVVVTLGKEGVAGVEADGEWSLPAHVVQVRDTTGAGDAFVGALAARLAKGATLQDAAEDANRVAAYSVQMLGAQASYPWKDDPLP